MEAGAGRVYLLPSDRPAIKESKEQLTLYAEGVKTKGRLHNMGSPHGYGAMGFVEGLNEDPDVPPESKAILAALARKNPSPQECGLSIPLFRLAKAYKDGIELAGTRYGRGDWFGECALLNAAPCSATVVRACVPAPRC